MIVTCVPRVDVLELVSQRCSGRRRCQLSVPDAMFDDTKPCNEDLKSYLQAGYDCVRGNGYRMKFDGQSTDLKLTILA